MRESEMTEYDDNTTEDVYRGAQKRETLGSIPCGFRDNGARREYANLDLFRVTDEVRDTAYNYLCIGNTEIRLNDKQTATLLTILG